MEQVPETLGQRIQRLRAASGLTQSQVAQKADVPVSSLRNWEIDRREPGFRAVYRLAKTLGVTMEELANTIEVQQGERAARPAGPTKRPAVAEPSPAKPSTDAPASSTSKPRKRRKE